MKIVEEINRMAELYPNLIAIKSDKDKPRIIATKNIRIELKQISLFNDLFGGAKYVSGRRRGLL